MSIRVLLADDHAIVRQGLCDMLEQYSDIEVVAQVADGLAALVESERCAPHVAVMDVSMPGMNGIEATRRIARDLPDTRVVCLSMHCERQYVCEVLLVGACGYVLKDAGVEELVRAIRVVADGGKYVSPAVTGVVLDALGAPGAQKAADSAARLTDREREVLQLLAEGHSTKEIALRLNISAKTVASHREHLMEKLDLDFIAGLTKFAIRHGITTVDRG